MKVVVIVGTKGPFPRLVDAALAWLHADPTRELWLQHAEPARDLPARAVGAALAPHAEVVTRMETAAAVLCHAGSGTLRDALRLGHVPVVVPRRAAHGEHINDHQLELVEALGDRVLACLTPERPDVLARALEEAAARRGAVRQLPGEALREDLRAAVATSRPAARAPHVWRALALATRPLRALLRGGTA